MKAKRKRTKVNQKDTKETQEKGELIVTGCCIGFLMSTDNCFNTLLEIFTPV